METDIYHPIFLNKITDIPNSERKSNVLRVDIQEGCYNRCNYCSVYKGTPFRNRPAEEIFDSIDRLAEVLANTFLMKKDINQFTAGKHTSPEFTAGKQLSRIFLCGADALRYPHNSLLRVIDYAREKIGYARGMQIGERYDIKRLGFNATTPSINSTSHENFIELRKSAGKSAQLIAYWGVESGSTETLRYANKPGSKKEMIYAGKKLRKAGIIPSINIMPGLGEEKFYGQHVRDSIDAIAGIEPRWVTFLTRKCKGTAYEAKCVAEGNRILTKDECTKQTIEIVLGLLPRVAKHPALRECMVASYTPDITEVADNGLSFSEKMKNPSELGDLMILAAKMHRIGLEDLLQETSDKAREEKLQQTLKGKYELKAGQRLLESLEKIDSINYKIMRNMPIYLLAAMLAMTGGIMYFLIKEIMK